MGKDAADIISRINGFTYVETRFDFEKNKLEILSETPYSEDERAKVRCFGAFEPREGIAIMEHEEVDVSISGNATHMIRFQHPVAGAYKKYCNDNQKKYFACASGGGIGRTLNPDDTSAGPSSYGQTDLMSRMYADATFAGSSSVPAHVEMMGVYWYGQQSYGRCYGIYGCKAGRSEKQISKRRRADMNYSIFNDCQANRLQGEPTRGTWNGFLQNV